MKCLLLEGIHDIAKKHLISKGIKVTQLNLTPSTGVLKKQIQYSALGIRSRTQITKEVLTALSPAIKLIGTFCIGTNQINLEAARKLGIPVFNAPYGNTRSVAELVLSHIISLSRQSFIFNHNMHNKKWNKTATGSKEIRGKTLGIIGYGHIGTQISILAEAMGMKVLYFDIIDTLHIGNAQPVSGLKELISNSDFVTLHVPQTKSTLNMIQEKQLKWFKKGAFLINTSRGNVVNLNHVKKAILSNMLGGAAIDVFPKEPKKNTSFTCVLQGLKQVILTPHIAGSTEEAQKNIALQVSTSITKYLMHGISEGAVNFPILNPPILQYSAKKYQRLINIHNNVPGVLGNINGLMSRLKINIQSQYLATKNDIGYLIMDIEQKNIRSLCQGIRSLDTSIRTEILPAPVKQ